MIPPVRSQNRIGYSLHRVVLLLGMTISLMSPASSVFGQSTLSLLYPVGLPVQPNSGMSFMMGGAGAAVAAPTNIMLLNPANLGYIDKTEFSSLISITATVITQSGNSSTLYSAMPQQISFAFPAGNFGTLGFSLDQRSNALAKFRTNPTPVQFDTLDILHYRAGVYNSGGLKSWQVGWGRELKSFAGMSVGVSYEKVYLNTDNKILRSIIDSSGTIESTDSTNYEFSGDAVRAGIMIPFKKLCIGVSGEYYWQGTLKKSNGLFSPGDTTPVVPPTQQRATLTLPSSITLGLAYNFSQEWLAAADVSAVLWHTYESEGMLAPSDRANALTVCGGVQYIPTTDMLNPKYLETVNYRAGFRYAQLPVDDNSEYALSFGIGLPIGGGRGICDIGAELGRRTNTQLSGYAENFISLTLGISGGSKWKKSMTGEY